MKNLASNCTFLPGTDIEIIHPEHSRGTICCALFDFDGTLSLVRAGWQAEMVPLMVELLQQTPQHEDLEDLEKFAHDFVDLTNGEQTIYQMARLAEEVKKRGAPAGDPLEYKQIFQIRLDRRIERRLQDFQEGKLSREEMMVPGTRLVLQALEEKHVDCFLASGTDQSKVEQDLELLQIGGYFKSVDGARHDDWSFSKRRVIERILDEKDVDGGHLIVFGDGFADMEAGRMFGAIAVGVAADERNGHGVDPLKRRLLIEAGADIIIPDYHQSRALVAYLFHSRD